MVDRAFELAKRYGEVEDGKYKNSDEWLRDVGAFKASFILEDMDEYRKGAMSEVRDLRSGEVSLSEVMRRRLEHRYLRMRSTSVRANKKQRSPVCRSVLDVRTGECC